MADDYILYRSYPYLRWWINWYKYQCPKSIKKREYVQANRKRLISGDQLWGMNLQELGIVSSLY